MKRLFGFINKCESSIDGEFAKVLETILENDFHIQKKIELKNGFFLEFGNVIHQTSESEDRHIIQIDGNIHNLNDLIQEYGLNAIDQNQVISDLYERFGAKVSELFIGDYVINIYDKQTGNFALIRDFFGTKPIYYTDCKDFFAYSSEIKFLKSICKEKIKPNIKKICSFLCQHKSDPSHTFYEGIFSLPPSNVLEKENDNFVIRTYKHYKDYKFKGKCFSEAKKELKIALESAYAVRKKGKTAVLLSGGLDSSVIYSIAEQNQNFNITSISYSFLDFKGNYLGCDETNYQNTVLKKSKGNIRINFKDKSPFSRIDKWLERYDQPFNLPNAYIFDEMYHTARTNGIDAVFDGVDGDLVCSHGWERFKELFKPSSILIFTYELFMFGRKHDYSSYTNSNLIKVFLKPLLLDNEFFKSITNGLRTVLKKPKFEHRPNKILSDHALKKFSIMDSYNKINNFRSHEEKISSPLIEQAFINSNILFFKDNVDQLSPFFDKRVVDLCVSFPSSFKLKNGQSRYILREAFKDTVPKEIIERFSKSNLSENFIKKINDNDIESIQSEIENIHPILRQFIDIQKLQNNFELMKKKQPGEQVSMNIWNFFLVNRWLKKSF